MQKLKQFTQTRRFLFILGCLFGAAIFVAIYGVRVLDFTYDGWLLVENSDLTQHYTAWQHFRASKWHFPLGLIDDLLYPHKVSILYLDGIPLFAVFFKILSPILPHTFQYMGLFEIICWALQGGMFVLIMNKLTGLRYSVILPSVFAVMSSTMLFRSFVHTALSAQFIILIAIYIFILGNDSKGSLGKRPLYWSLLLGLCPVIQAYFIPMVFIFICADVLRYWLCSGENLKRKILQSGIQIGGSFVFLLTVMACFGAFYGKFELWPNSWIGEFSATLISLFSQRTSRSYFLNPPVEKRIYAYEGSAYLGIGVMILLVIAFCSVLQNITLTKVRNNIKNIIPMAFIVLSSMILSMSPSIRFGDKVLFTIPYPEFILKNVFGNFRTNGRFIWIVFYLLIIFAVWMLFKYYKKQVACCVVLCCVAGG